MDIQNSIENVISLGVLAAESTFLLETLSKINNTGLGALKAVGLLTAIAVPLAAFALDLALMSALEVQNAIANAAALSILTTVSSLLLGVLGGVGALGLTALIGVGLLLAMAVPMVAFVGIIALMSNIENAIESTNMLMDLMTRMTLVMGILAVIGPLATVGIAAAWALIGTILVIGLLAAAIGGINELTDGAFKTFLESSFDILISLSEKLGEIVGSFITGIGIGLTNDLYVIAENLNKFVDKFAYFAEAIKVVDEETLNATKLAAATILILAATDVIAAFDALAASVVGTGGFQNLSKNLVTVASGMSSFALTLRTNKVNPDELSSFAESVLILAQASEAIPKNGGIASIFAGWNTMEDSAKEYNISQTELESLLKHSVEKIVKYILWML